MHEHTSAAVELGTLLHALVLCSVTAATLFICRRLAEHWAGLHDRVTPATHAGMGAAMVCTMVAHPVRPVLIAGGVAFALLAALLCRRALRPGTALGQSERINTLATAGTAVVMALMLLVVVPGRALTIALLGCLLLCGAVYARSTMASRRTACRHSSDGPHLAMTASMAAMVAGL